VTGRPAVPNEEIAEVAAADPDVLIPFASVDPNKAPGAVEEAKRLIRDYGVKGFKLHFPAGRRSTSRRSSSSNANTLLRDRVLFGSDFPLITPDRWLEDFARTDLRDDVRPLVLKQNAARLLGLAE